MKLCRFALRDSGMPGYGIIEGEVILPFPPHETVETLTAPLSSKPIPFKEVHLLAPVIPSKIVCVGRNYREHAAELGHKMPDEPLLFLKAPSAIVGTGGVIELPPQSSQVEHEGELGVVIGRKASNIGQNEDPLSYVLGYTCINDVTARDLQRKDVQFTRAKSFDTFCPVGPWIVTDLNPSDLEVTTRLNGELRQHGRTADMAFSVPFLIEYVAAIMTLYPGDLIATGTPAGVSRMQAGDVVEIEGEGIGVLRNEVRNARQTRAISRSRCQRR